MMLRAVAVVHREKLRNTALQLCGSAGVVAAVAANGVRSQHERRPGINLARHVHQQVAIKYPCSAAWFGWGGCETLGG